MAIAGKAGNVYGNALLIEDCEDAWTTGGAGRVVSTTTGKVGTYSARVTTTTIGVTTLLSYEAITKNLTTYDGIYWWTRNSQATAAGGLQLLLDESADCLSPEESLNFPTCVANTWRQCFARLSNPSVLDAVVAVGLYQVTDLSDDNFDIDDVEALQELDGIKSWSLDSTADTLEATDFDDVGVKAYIIGGSGWSGSFEGFKDTTPLGIGAEVYLVLGESTTAYQNWIGKAIITACHPSTSLDGIVTYAYDFQGTGELKSPDA